jgi:hypothetical protein
MSPKSDYITLKYGLEGLALDDKIPIKHSRVLKNSTANEDGDVVMDVSDYDEDAVQAIIDGIDLSITERPETDELLIEGDF